MNIVLSGFETEFFFISYVRSEIRTLLYITANTCCTITWIRSDTDPQTSKLFIKIVTVSWNLKVNNLLWIGYQKYIYERLRESEYYLTGI